MKKGCSGAAAAPPSPTLHPKPKITQDDKVPSLAKPKVARGLSRCTKECNSGIDPEFTESEAKRNIPKRVQEKVGSALPIHARLCGDKDESKDMRSKSGDNGPERPIP